MDNKNNTGEKNSGNWNSGNRNSGNWNSGNWNSGYWNSGDFNTNEPDKIRIFNTWVNMTPSQFLEKHNVYADIPLNRWVNVEDMTEDEKKSVKGCTEMGGYLKTLPFKEACQIWWKENPSEHHRFLNLPAFDPAIFKKITGIEVAQKTPQTPETIELNGRTYKLVE